MFRTTDRRLNEARRPSSTLSRAVIETLDSRRLLSATGWSGGEPASYATTIHVDAAFAGGEGPPRRGGYDNHDGRAFLASDR